MRNRNKWKNMNPLDKAAAIALCVAVGVGLGITIYQNSRPLPEGGQMTVVFSDVPDSFGRDIAIGEVVTDHNLSPIGTVLNVSRDEEGALFLSVATTPEYPGAIGQTVFLRGKHFAGTGKITLYQLSKGASWDAAR